MNTRLLCLLMLLILCLRMAAAAPPSLKHGDVIFQTGFEEADALATWGATGNANVRLAVGDQSRQSLMVEQPVAAGPGGTMLHLPLPLDRLRGARLRFEARVKAEDVAKPPQPWSGVKFMLHTVGAAGAQWPQQNDVWGTFDWKSVGFVAAVPKDATEADLMLGLEATTGRVWFDNIRVTVETPPRPPRRAGSHPVYKGHTLPRLRGAMIGTGGDPKTLAENLRVLGTQWKANVVRWQLVWNGSEAGLRDPAAYDAWLEKSLTTLDQMLPVCRQAGLLVVVDLHTPPSGLFTEKRGQDQFLAVWDKIARRYRGQPAVWGYDLLNEPHEGLVPERLMDWHTLVTQAAQRVRAIDRKHALIVEPMDGAPDELEYFEPLPVAGVIYSVHMYLPHTFTHQGVLPGKPIGVRYPGLIDGEQWDQSRLRRALKTVVDWQRDYGEHIYIGEFSAIRWAPDNSAYRYLRDLIDIFEANGWDWTYHAFREWPGWSVEYGPDPQATAPSPEPTDRERLLRAWFAKNLKPQSH